MREPIFLMLFVVGFALLFGLSALRVARPRGIGRIVDVVGGMLGTLLWGVVALGSLGIEAVNGGSGAIQTYSEPTVAWLSVALLAINFLIMLDGTQRIVDLRAAEPGPGEKPSDDF